jgi:hypothetical protein
VLPHYQVSFGPLLSKRVVITTLDGIKPHGRPRTQQRAQVVMAVNNPPRDGRAVLDDLVPANEQRRRSGEANRPRQLTSCKPYTGRPEMRILMAGLAIRS